MDDLDFSLGVPFTAQLCALLFIACATGRLVILIATPRRDCLFLRWEAEVRLLALVISPVLLIVWPLVLSAWFLKSGGVDAEDLDFED
jgi:hypothetical protein